MADNELPVGLVVQARELRIAHGLTLKQLAERITEQGRPISEGGVSNIENGNKNASPQMRVAWAKALGLKALDLHQGPLKPDVVAGIPSRKPAA